MSNGPSSSRQTLVSWCEHPFTDCAQQSARGERIVLLECSRCGKTLTVPANRILVAHSLRHTHDRKPSAMIPSSGSSVGCAD